MIYAVTSGPAAIQCGFCRRVSYHPMDVKHRYCGNCHLFFDAVMAARLAHRDGMTHDCGEWRTAAGLCAVCGSPQPLG